MVPVWHILSPLLPLLSDAGVWALARSWLPLLLILGHFHHPNKKSCYQTVTHHFSRPSSTPQQPPICFLSPLISLVWMLHFNGVVQFVASDWLLSYRIIFSQFIHVIICISISFLFMALYCSIVWVYHILSVCRSMVLWVVSTCV